MRIAIVLAALAATAAPASAQGFDDDPPAVSVRPYVEVSQQKFVATSTFDNVFGESSAPFWGAGAQVAFWEGRIYGEAGVTRIARDRSRLIGERVFVSGNDVYKLGIPLRATIKPWRVLGGYRFRLSPRFIPYVGAGVVSYQYTEESDFALPAENLDVSRRGAVVQGGLEVRLHRWMGVMAGVERTRVTGILGEGGISQLYESGDLESTGSESDIGGWSLQVRFVVGR